MAYANTTLPQLRQKVRDRLLPTFWVDDELNRLIIEAIRVWNVLTGYHRSSTTITVPAGTVWFSLEDNLTNYLWLMRAEFDDVHVDVCSMYELDKMRPTWMCDTGTVSHIMPVGLNKIAIHPAPTIDTSMTVEYVRTANVPNPDTDPNAFIQIGEEDMAAIIAYCHFAAVLKEGGKELQDVVPQLQYFLMQAAKHNSKLNTISVFRKLLGFGGLKATRPQYGERASPRGRDPQQ